MVMINQIMRMYANQLSHCYIIHIHFYIYSIYEYFEFVAHSSREHEVREVRKMWNKMQNKSHNEVRT